MGEHPLVRVVRPHLRGDVSAVGGAVRDAMLRRPPGPELDLVVEGDAIALARHLGGVLAARVVAHPRFRTAEVRLEGGRHVDLVSARTETLRDPGSPPHGRPTGRSPTTWPGATSRSTRWRWG